MRRLLLQKRSTAPPGANRSVTIYAAADGSLKQVAEDGTESDLGGASPGGSQPIRVVHKTINFDDANLVTGVPVTTIAEGETLLRWGAFFVPTVWDGATPYGAFIGDNGVDAPYEFLAGVPLSAPPQNADVPAISGEPGHPDLWSEAANGSSIPIALFLGSSWEARDGDVDLLFRVSSGDDGATDPEATQGQAKIKLVILAAP